MSDIHLNMLVCSICLFLYVFILSLATLIIKKDKCNLDIPYKNYCIWSLTPFFLILVIILLKHYVSILKSVSPFYYYLLFSIIFLVTTFLIVNHSNNISPAEDNQLSDFNTTCLLWMVIFIVLRFILYFHSSSITGFKFIIYLLHKC